MRTDELIDRLGRDVTVAQPLPARGIRTAMWTVWAVRFLVVVAVMMFAVMSWAGRDANPTLSGAAKCGVDIAKGIMAARAALASVIPGTSSRVWVLPAIGAAVWGGSLLWAGMLDLQASGTMGVAESERLALRRLNDSGPYRRRVSTHLDVAARRSVDAWPHGLPRLDFWPR